MTELKKIVVVSALYPPESVISAQISFDIANLFVKKGHQVTVICPYPTRPLGYDFSDFEYKNGIKETEDGLLKVVHVTSFVSPKSQLFKRLWESLSFGFHSSRYIKKHLTGSDVVYANTWPLLGQWILAKTLKKLKIPLVLHIQDVYPESLIEKLPYLFKKLLIKPLIAFDKQIANNSSLLVVVSENMKNLYQKNRNILAKKVLLIQNWKDESFFVNLENEQINDKVFTFMYLGNIGPVAGVDFLIMAFNEAKLHTSQLIIAGSGSEKGNCQNMVSKLNLSNVYFIPAKLENVAQIQKTANILLLPTKKNAAMSSIPSKLIAYMFSEKPIIATVDAGSDTANAIENAKCGWVGEPENIAWLSEKMKELTQLPESTLAEMGKNGLKFGLKNYSKKYSCEKLCSAIIAVANEYK